MNINPIASYNKNNKIQPTFKEVNKKYYDLALKKAITGMGYVLENLRYDVMLFKKVNVQDAIDTMLAIRKHFNGQTDEFFNHILSSLKKERELQAKKQRKLLKKAKKST